MEVINITHWVDGDLEQILREDQEFKNNIIDELKNVWDNDIIYASDKWWNKYKMYDFQWEEFIEEC